MKVKVEIYHNVEPHGGGFFGLNSVFDEGGKRQARTDAERHPLVKVFEYEAELPDIRIDDITLSNDILTLCEEAFRTFNIGEDDLAVSYRSLGLRSLSVGDVVVIGGGVDPVAFSCESCGFVFRSPSELRIVKG